ncbi:MAG: hypothetical protein Q9177_005987, partial [Variospora cf. flavescens]
KATFTSCHRPTSAEVTPKGPASTETPSTPLTTANASKRHPGRVPVSQLCAKNGIQRLLISQQGRERSVVIRMAQIGSRKRPAPGASPILQQPQAPSDPPLISADKAPKQSARLNPVTDPTTSLPYPEYLPSTTSNYPQSPQSAVPQQQPTSNQVTRRPPDQDTGQVQHPSYTNGNSEIWPLFNENGLQQLNETGWRNEGDDLDQKALVAKRDAQAKRKQIPPFVQNFLDESRNTELIRWSDSGDSFVVLDEDEFARTLIPELFKHKNYASFVRQLNMYGFHKKVGLSDNSMRASERKNKTPSEYYNPYFKRGRPNLLWLIHKPRNPQARGGGRGGRGRQEDTFLDEEVEEIYDMDQLNHGNQAAADASNMRQGRQPLMIGNGSHATQDLANVQEELQVVRKQQEMIAALLQKTRAEHEQLYGQAANFQKLHDRHESSINAILTFLATVYSRNLEGKGGPNFGGMFGSISQDTQGQGNVVDVGDYRDQNMSNGQNQAPFRKQPLLLGAPPSVDRWGSIASPAASADSPSQQPHDRLYPGRNQAGVSPANQEAVDTPSNRSSQSPQIQADGGDNGQPSQADILSMIQSSNANQPYYTGSRMDFPEALSHLQTADGQLPLTANQRDDALRLIASTAGKGSADSDQNALTSPSPPMPNMAQYQQSKERLDQLSNALREQDSKVNQLSNVLAPLSPSGSVPGISDTQNYGDPGGNDMLDLDQIFNSGDYFNDGAATGDAAADLGSNDEPLPDFNFDIDGHNNNNGDAAEVPFFGFDGSAAAAAEEEEEEEEEEEGKEGSAVETVDSSEAATSPANTMEEENNGFHQQQEEGMMNPRKRRRKG